MNRELLTLCALLPLLGAMIHWTAIRTRHEREQHAIQMSRMRDVHRLEQRHGNGKPAFASSGIGYPASSGNPVPDSLQPTTGVIQSATRAALGFVSDSSTYKALGRNLKLRADAVSLPSQPNPNQPVWASGGVWHVHGDVDKVYRASGTPSKGGVKFTWSIQERWDPARLEWQLIRMEIRPEAVTSPLRTAPWASEPR